MMNATGLYAYRFRDTYFIFPCYHDSYPSGLGTALIQNIPGDHELFEEWLKTSKEHYERACEKLQLSDPTDDLGYYRRPSSDPPVKDAFIEWIYIIDLDRMAFSVDGGAHFKLDRIPRGEDGEEWIQYLDQDGLGWRCLKPCTPQRAVADLHPDLTAISESAITYRSLKATLIDITDWSQPSSAPELASQALVITVVKAIVSQYYGRLSNAYQYAPTDPRFQHPAECLFRATAPNFLQLQLYVEDTIETVLSAPEDDGDPGHGAFYWFRGCLILLSSRLDAEMHLQASVSQVVAHVQEKGIEFCTALIWSLRHVVVVRVSRDGVAHSSAQPILAAYGVDDAAFIAGIRLLTHYLRPVHADIESEERETSADRSESGHNMPPITRPEEPPTSNRVCLPMDVVLEIMKFADVDTYNNVFSRLSRATRSVFARRPRIGPYTVYGCTGEQYLAGAEIAGNGCSLLARTENGSPVHLKLIHREHCLDNDLTTCSNPELEDFVHVSVRLPIRLEGARKAASKTEQWFDVRRSALLLEES